MGIDGLGWRWQHSDSTLSSESPLTNSQFPCHSSINYSETLLLRSLFPPQPSQAARGKQLSRESELLVAVQRVLFAMTQAQPPLFVNFSEVDDF